jgi:hypothetical protein
LVHLTKCQQYREEKEEEEWKEEEEEEEGKEEEEERSFVAEKTCLDVRLAAPK